VEEEKKNMDDLTFFTSVLVELYGLSPTGLQSLSSSSLEDGRKTYQMYLVEQLTGHAQVLFAYHRDFITGPTFAWGCDQALDVWLQHRAELLVYLAQQQYPSSALWISGH
jgi:hypothetical protein